MRNDNMECFLTYADNNAVGYFAKQGFTKEISFDRERVNPHSSSIRGGPRRLAVLAERVFLLTMPWLVLSPPLYLCKSQVLRQLPGHIWATHPLKPALCGPSGWPATGKPWKWGGAELSRAVVGLADGCRRLRSGWATSRTTTGGLSWSACWTTRFRGRGSRP